MLNQVFITLCFDSPFEFISFISIFSLSLSLSHSPSYLLCAIEEDIVYRVTNEDIVIHIIFSLKDE